MSKIEDVLEKIDDTSPGSSDYHLACAEWCWCMKEIETDTDMKTAYQERGEMHQLMATVFKGK